MKTFIKIQLLATVLIFNHVMAQQDISGIWQGKLDLGGDQSLTVQFILEKQDDGAWSAIVNSPDTGGIKNVKAGAVAFDGTSLNIDVAELSGGFKGQFKDGKFEGTWSQAGSDMPLILAPYTKPVLSQADMDLLAGEWVGKLEVPAGALTLVFRFEINAAGELAGFIRSPDQGGNEAPAADIELVDGVLSLKVPAAQVDIKGKLSGTQFAGEFKQGQGTMPLTMNKGEYVPPKYVLALSNEVMAQLLGEWHGEFEMPMGTLTVIYRFEYNATGEFIANRSSPDQGGSGVPIMEATLTDGSLTLKTADGGFTGKLDGETIAGTVTNPMGAIPLTVKKGQFVPPAYNLKLAKEAMDLLLGKWTGKLATPQRTLTLVFRFEADAAGEYFGFVDSPDQGNTSLKIVEAGFADGELSLKTKFPKAEFKGKLNGGELNGNWSQMGGTMPLVLNKE
ncbi:MAG: hypothetical protein EPO31_03185 [Gammaproteobacteria bacterium]|nr:MAG: hypothetical protein EPO31_03185 [Gammaproteobacteria bacterium]